MKIIVQSISSIGNDNSINDNSINDNDEDMQSFPDEQAREYIERNTIHTFSRNKKGNKNAFSMNGLLTDLLFVRIKEEVEEMIKAVGNKTVCFCGNTGLLMSYTIDKNLHSFPLQTISQVSSTKDMVKYLLAVSRKELYEQNKNSLAAFVLILYKAHKKLFTSYEQTAIMDNIILQTASKDTLITLIKEYAIFHNTDFDGLPKLDISYLIHKDGITSLDTTLLTYTKSCITAYEVLNTSLAERRLQALQEEAEIAELIRQRRLAVKAKPILQQYDTSRKDAKKALRNVSYLLVEMGYSKLLSLLVQGTTTGAANFSTEIRDRICLRLAEIKDKTEADLSTELKALETLTAYFKLSTSAKVVSAVITPLESVSDTVRASANKENNTTNSMSLAERLRNRLATTQSTEKE